MAEDIGDNGKPFGREKWWTKVTAHFANRQRACADRL
jgi:hypothetical protein